MIEMFVISDLYECVRRISHLFNRTQHDEGENEMGKDPNLDKIEQQRVTRQKSFFNGCARNYVQSGIAMAIKKGADIYAKTEDGKTPVQVALEANANKAAVLLLAIGCDYGDAEKALANGNKQVTDAFALRDSGETDIEKFIALYPKAKNFGNQVKACVL